MIRFKLLTVAALLAAVLSAQAVRAAEPTSAEAAGPAQPAQDAALPAAEAQRAAATTGEEYDPPPGFKTKKRKGETVYCRSRAPMGTRIKTEECFTQAEIVEVERAMRLNRDDQAQRARMCTKGAMCTGGG